MVHHFYHLDYPHISPAPSNSRPSEEPKIVDKEVRDTPRHVSTKKKTKTVQKTLIRPDPNFVIHARVYAIAEKYGIPGLKALALKKFEDETAWHWNTDDFLHAVEEVYTSTVEHDRNMRNIVLKTMDKHAVLLDKEEMQKTIKGLDLPFDLLMYQRRRVREGLARNKDWNWAEPAEAPAEEAPAAALY